MLSVVSHYRYCFADSLVKQLQKNNVSCVIRHKQLALNPSSPVRKCFPMLKYKWRNHAIHHYCSPSFSSVTFDGTCAHVYLFLIGWLEWLRIMNKIATHFLWNLLHCYGYIFAINGVFVTCNLHWIQWNLRLFIHFAFGVSTKCLWSRLRRIMKYLIVINVWLLEYQMFVLIIHFQFMYIWDIHYLVLCVEKRDIVHIVVIT
jgi:hypothetical protein